MAGGHKQGGEAEERTELEPTGASRDDMFYTTSKSVLSIRDVHTVRLHLR